MIKIAVATTTRADWGLLSPLARELENRGANVLVMAANMHYNSKLGMTVNEITADGFTPVLECKTQGSPAEIAAACLKEFSQALERERPACIICLGDRYEMLSIVQAAVMSGVPVVHIAGGAVSEGAADDMFRHAITKLSSLHLTECEEYRNRVISMNEDPHLVIDTGAIGIHNILSLKPIPAEELAADLGFTVDRDTLLCTMHIATLDTGMSPLQQYDALLSGIEKALAENPRLKILFTYPNNDVDPLPLIERLEEFRDRYPDRVLTVPSLGVHRYLSALRYSGGLIGNSSSGIVEVASLGVPVLDIGIRQQGRMRADSVIHAECDANSIARGIRRLFTPEVRELAARCENPYARPDTLDIMVRTILHTFNL